MSQRNGGVKTRAFKAAFPKVLPICISFFFLAMSYGVLMGTRGFSFLWPLCMSASIYTGSMEFVTVNLLVSAFNPFATLMLALMMGTRHLFYGLSMLGRFKNMGAKKPYLIYAMCDETFAVNNSAQIPADADRGWFYFFVSLLNQVSWVAGATLGGIVGWRLMAALTGIVVPVICMALFGADHFMIPSLIAMLVMFIMLRPYLDDLKPDDVGKRDDADGAVESAADRNEVGEARS